MAATGEDAGREAPKRLEAAHFAPHVGKTFCFGGRALTLDRVILEGENSGTAQRRPFTLIFRGPKARDALPEGCYDCEVEGGPRFSLHVAPIHTPAPDWQEHQAVFN